MYYLATVTAWRKDAEQFYRILTKQAKVTGIELNIEDNELDLFAKLSEALKELTLHFDEKSDPLVKEKHLTSFSKAMIMAGAKWHYYGAPVLQLSPEQFTALAMTDVRVEDTEDLHPPWPTFLLHVPCLPKNQFLLTGRYSDEFPEHFREYLEERNGELSLSEWPYWFAFHPVEKLERVLHFHESLKMFTQMATGTKDDYEGWRQVEEEDLRLYAALIKVTLNACIWIKEHGPPVLIKAGKGKKLKAVKQNKYTLPNAKKVVFGRYQEVLEYIRGDRRSLPKGRWPVRGHWRNQAYGAGRQKRKKIWIAPHWAGKGDVKMPIPVNASISKEKFNEQNNSR